MSGVFQPGTRPDQWRTLGDHQRRIQALEATPPGGGTAGVGTPPLTYTTDGADTVSAPVIDSSLTPADNTVVLGDGARMHAASLDVTLGDGSPDTQFYGRDVILLTGLSGISYLDQLAVTMGDNATAFRGNNVYTLGGNSNLNYDILVATADVDSYFLGRDWKVTVGLSGSTSVVDKLNVNADGDADLRGLDHNVFKLSGSGDVFNRLTVASDSGDATALILEGGSNSGLSMALRVNGGLVDLNLPMSDPGVSGALWNNGGIVTVSP